LIDSVRDDVRKGTAVSGEALSRVRKLYPSRERMQRLIEEDNERYGAALAKAIQPFLADSDRSKPADTVSEPVNEILVKQYNPDVSLNTAALELGVSAEQLKAAIAKSESLRELGLRILTTGGGIKRDLWDNGDRLSFTDPDGHSLFHKTARALGLGNRRVVGR
jgi:biotin operon repressor